MRTGRALRRWGQGWTAAGHLGLDVLLATPWLLVVSVTLAGLSLIPVLVGIPLLALGLALAVPAAAVERERLAATTGLRIPPPVDPVPRADLPGPGQAGHRVVRLFHRLFDPVRWRMVAYLFVVPVWGSLCAAVVLALLGLGAGAAAAPLYTWGLPNGFPVLGAWASGVPGTLLVSLVGVLVLAVTPMLAWALVRVNLALGRALLGPGRQEVESALHARVDTLTSSRDAVVDSVEAERQRIERDLHDGPQQRLVALSMGVGLARHRLQHDPAGAADLLEEVQATARQAMAEMRQVARGIHPPVLTDRGLDAALSALAASCPVRVQVRVEVPQRPSPTVESIAYFTVSEALTNVAKHSGAQQVDVHVQSLGGDLVVQVSDDGRGGARTDTAGTGLRGLADRAAAVDGQLHLSSPPGGPTVLTLRLPLQDAEADR